MGDDVGSGSGSLPEIAVGVSGMVPTSGDLVPSKLTSCFSWSHMPPSTVAKSVYPGGGHSGPGAGVVITPDEGILPYCVGPGHGPGLG